MIDPHVEVKSTLEESTGDVAIEVWLNQRRALTLDLGTANRLNLRLVEAINQATERAAAWEDRQIAREDYDGRDELGHFPRMGERA